MPALAPLSVAYQISPPLHNKELNALFTAAWLAHAWRDFAPVLEHSLAYVCAYHAETLIGFVNLAWDGGIHALLLDTTVHPAYQRQGIGRQLVGVALQTAQRYSIVWLHVDYEPTLEHFYQSCGFTPTLAGLIRL